MSEQELIIQTIQTKALDRLQELLDRGSDPDTLVQNSMSALLYALKNKDIAIVKILLEAGANPNLSQSPPGLSPLMLAAATEQEQALDLLLKFGAQVNQVNEDGSPALMAAAYRGNIQILSSLLKAGALPNLEDKDGDTALNIAIKRGHLEAVGVLLEAGGDPYSGLGALQIALRQKQQNIVRLLVDRQIKINQPNRQGITALDVAIRTHQHSFLDYALKKGYSQTLGHIFLGAVAEREISVVLLLLESGIDIETKDEDGSSALHLACLEGHFEIARILLGAGANPNAKDNIGDTPLVLASLHGHGWIVQILLEYGADASSGNPLSLALSRDDWQVATILLMGGADPDIILENGKTVLAHAVTTGKIELVKLVLQAGADVNLVDHSGSSPLMWASHQGNLAIIRHLLSIDGIALDLKNRGGYTALGIATSNKNQQVFELLTQAGA